MSALPYMPLFVADYLADTAHLTATEHGAYLLLIMNYWQRGKPLPDDDLRLSRIARIEPADWPDMRAALEEFFEVVDGEWIHGRIEAELSHVRQKSDKAKFARSQGKDRPVRPTSDERQTDVRPSEQNRTDKEKSTNLTVGRARKRASTIPDGFPFESDLEWTKAECPSIDGANEAQQIRDHALRDGVTHKDWSAAWRTWCRNAVKWSRPRAPPATGSNIERIAAFRKAFRE